jgi:hypothetical protein
MWGSWLDRIRLLLWLALAVTTLLWIALAVTNLLA